MSDVELAAFGERVKRRWRRAIAMSLLGLACFATVAWMGDVSQDRSRHLLGSLLILTSLVVFGVATFDAISALDGQRTLDQTKEDLRRREAP